MGFGSGTDFSDDCRDVVDARKGQTCGDVDGLDVIAGWVETVTPTSMTGAMGKTIQGDDITGATAGLDGCTLRVFGCETLGSSAVAQPNCVEGASTLQR